ncbi:hypothetical protein CDAR_273501 [Caerostris darwini]|uniref:Uncharacterized protein n=1 Tax=Caerostris darwini TaxID=1538125 RepID=A0AAV4W522_9ARAC|nr:hypothetical protein CDAR_273501 [Caerostris darwini]
MPPSHFILAKHLYKEDEALHLFLDFTPSGINRAGTNNRNDCSRDDQKGGRKETMPFLLLEVKSLSLMKRVQKMIWYSFKRKKKSNTGFR